MTKDTIIKFLNNRCTAAELEEVARWANTGALNKKSVTLAFDEWRSFQVGDNLGDDEKFSLLFDKIQRKIDTDDQKQKNTESKISTLSIVSTWLTRAAAILLIPVLAFLFYTLSEKKLDALQYANLSVDSIEVIAPIGSRTVVQLSDGSEVYLNYGSKLKYPQVFLGDTREVILSGEGYFQVAHNPGKPFIVKTGKLDVKALGTVFNVLGYPNEDNVETTLVEGKVVLGQTGNGPETKILGVMEPGQHVNYNLKTGVVSSTKGSIEKYIAWKNGKMVFEDTPIARIAERLSRMFNVDIEVADDIKGYIYTVTFVDEPLFQILDLMTIATPVSYKALPRKKLPDGTFTKQKIIIEKKTIKLKPNL